MSKRQADYLTSLLASPSPSPSGSETDAPQPLQTAKSLLARESALARVAGGEIKQVTELRLDPSRVRIWEGNPRSQAHLTEANCRDLINAILSEGGQKIPAIVRRITNDTEHDYEVIAGSRRHFAISWLRQNNYPDMVFLAQVHSLDDEAAFRLSDIENRARKDVSDFERARTYLKALSLHYNNKQNQMAERLHLSKGWLSKMLTVGALPEWVTATFANPTDIQLATCYPLAQSIQNLINHQDTNGLETYKNRAHLLITIQNERRARSEPSLQANEIVRGLMYGLDEKKSEPTLSFNSQKGRLALSITSANRNGVSLRLHAGSGASETELKSLFAKALDALDAHGKGLRP
jgi:ParB family chromosome partitioning protein